MLLESSSPLGAHEWLGKIIDIVLCWKVTVPKPDSTHLHMISAMANQKGKVAKLTT